MAYTVDIEDVVFKIIDVLGDGFPAKLDTIDTAKNDDITLDDVVKWYVGDKDFLPSIHNMPCVIVKGRGYVPTPTATDKLHRDSIRIEIECYVGHDANQEIEKDGRTYSFEELLEIRIMRYSRAIVELLTENEQLGGKTTLLNFTDVLISNVLPLEAGIMTKACRVEVEYEGVLNSLG